MNVTKISIPFSLRLRRCLAWALDWNIIGGIAMIITMTFWEVAAKTEQKALVLISFPVILAWFVLFILRDVVFGGKSLGKRIMKLQVIDKHTGMPASKKQKALRGLSLLFISFDALFLLISGYSIGDRLGDTAVVRDTFTLSPETVTIQNGYYVNESGKIVPEKTSKKTIVIVIVAIVAIIAAIAIIISVVFNSVKKSEEYSIAYDYLVTSLYFDYFDLSENDVQLTGYSSTTYPRYGERHVEFTFKIEKRFVKVYCIQKDGSWSVDEGASRLNTPNT